MEATKEETAAAVEKMKSEFAHVHDYLDGKTETSHNVRKRHQASKRDEWEELISRVQLSCKVQQPQQQEHHPEGQAAVQKNKRISNKIAI